MCPGGAVQQQKHGDGWEGSRVWVAHGWAVQGTVVQGRGLAQGLGTGGTGERGGWGKEGRGCCHKLAKVDHRRHNVGYSQIRRHPVLQVWAWAHGVGHSRPKLDLAKGELAKVVQGGTCPKIELAWPTLGTELFVLVCRYLFGV